MNEYEQYDFGESNNSNDSQQMNYSNYQNTTGQQAFDGSGTPKDPTFTKNLILSILTFMCCCQPLGLAAIIITVIANSSYNSGNYADYESKTKIVKILVTVGIIVGALVIVGYTALYGISFIASLKEY